MGVDTRAAGLPIPKPPPEASLSIDHSPERSSTANEPATRVVLGSNDLFGVPFPLVLADRFFHIYADPKGALKLDIFRWDEAERAPVYEVRASKPLDEAISTNPTGIVTFGDETGGFLYKFRPKPGVSQIFGRIPVPDEIEVHINDHSLRVLRGGQLMTTLVANQFVGMAVAIQIGADGSMAIGSNSLPEGMTLVRGR